MMTSTTQDTTVYGSVEAGGTKWVCAVGSEPDDLRAETRFPTTTPTETLARAIAFFHDYQHLGQLAAIGVGSLGTLRPPRNQAGRTPMLAARYAKRSEFPFTSTPT